MTRRGETAMNIYTFADKVERVSFVNGAVLLSFSSYDPAENTFRNVLTIKLSLKNFLHTFRGMQEFHSRLMNDGVKETAAVEAESTPAVKQDPAVKPEEKARPRRAKRRKTATREQE